MPINTFNGLYLMKMKKYGGIMELTNKLISEYPGETIIGILVLSTMVYDPPANLDTTGLYQSVNYLKNMVI
ncbi:MAG: hypothetical protein DRP06_01555 [Candidatus Aenigmatarchaeota archaeon]|nr:MAG: hypothetical protein DRP06_01555 [Candidatus Aenigmarchaeota archaeon]